MNYKYLKSYLEGRPVHPSLFDSTCFHFPNPVAVLLSSASGSVLFQDKSKNTVRFAEVAAQAEECRYLGELGVSLSKDTRDIWIHIRTK